MQLTVKDLKFVWLGVMVFLLAANANSFVHAGEQKSTYDAPWVHPTNAPQDCN